MCPELECAQTQNQTSALAGRTRYSGGQPALQVTHAITQRRPNMHYLQRQTTLSIARPSPTDSLRLTVLHKSVDIFDWQVSTVQPFSSSTALSTSDIVI